MSAAGFYILLVCYLTAKKKLGSDGAKTATVWTWSMNESKDQIAGFWWTIK